MIHDRQELEAALLEFDNLTEAVNAIGRSCKDTITDTEFGAAAGPLINRMREITTEAREYAETVGKPPAKGN